MGGGVETKKISIYMVSSKFGWGRKFTNNYGTQTFCLTCLGGLILKAAVLNGCIFNHLEVRNPLFF